MKAIILAAGRGSRLKHHTSGQPKCLVELAGKPLLFWQLSALAEAGADDIAVVCGYQSHLIKELADKAPAPFVPIENKRWAETNMLASLWCASKWANGDDCLISYSDIVYPTRHVCALISAIQAVALTYDRNWEELWSLRNNGKPLNDAETFLAEDGLLLEIGQKPESLEQVHGQYMGLLKLSPNGWQICRDNIAELGPAADKTDMTTFLRLLLSNGVSIGAVPVDGAWCEVDSDNDLDLYEKALASNSFSHDWRS